MAIQSQRFSFQTRPNLGHSQATRFSGKKSPKKRDSNPDTPPTGHGWLSKLLLGAGAVAGLVFAGRWAFKAFGSTLLTKGLSQPVREEVSETIKPTAKKALKKSAKKTPTKTDDSATGVLPSLVATGGSWLLGLLPTGLVATLIADRAKAFCAQYSALKAFEPALTKENIQKYLNPEFIQGVLHDITEHKLYSSQAIRDYVSKNQEAVARQIAEFTGIQQKTVHDTLGTIISTFGESTEKI